MSASLDDGSLGVHALYLADMSVHEFRRRVRRWANCFPPTYRTLVYVIGNAVQLETSIATIKQQTIQMKMAEALDVQGHIIHTPPSVRWIRERSAELRRAGILDVYQPRKVVTKPDGRQGFRALSNQYSVNFNRVLHADGSLVPHDFLAEIHDEAGINSSSTAAPTPAALPFRSSTDPTATTLLPAMRAPSAASGDAPEPPENGTEDHWHDDAELWASMAEWLAEEHAVLDFRWEIARRKWDELLIDFFTDDLDGLHRFRQVLNEFLDQHPPSGEDISNPAGFVVSEYPRWTRDHHYSLAEIDAGLPDLDHDAG